jgi:hypothetical protein
MQRDGTFIKYPADHEIYTRDSERGLALVGQAKQLNPNHPGWYWYADFYNAYRQADCRRRTRSVQVNLS